MNFEFAQSPVKNAKIRIKNFRSLEDVEVEIKPLTFLFGPNGSGKSSFIKALKLLNKNLFPLKDSLDYKIDDETDLTSFEEIITNNDLSKQLLFEINFDTDFSGLLPWENSALHFYLSKNNLSIENKFETDENFNVKKIEMYKNEMWDDILLNVLRKLNKNQFKYEIGYSTNLSANENSELTFDKEKIRRNFLRITDKTKEILFEDIREKKFLNRKGTYKQILEQFNRSENNYIIEKLLIKILKNESNYNLIQFLINENSFKENDFRLYYEKENYVKFLIQKINECLYLKFQDNIDWLTLSREEKTEAYTKLLYFFLLINFEMSSLMEDIFNVQHIKGIRKLPQHFYKLNEIDKDDYYGLIKNRKDSEFLDDVNEQIQKFGLGEKIEIIEEKDKIKIVLTKKGSQFNLAEASSGTLQLLPIIIQTLIKRTDPTYDEEYMNNYHIEDPNKKALVQQSIIIEQPELHLHPKLQAKLVEYFAEVKHNYIIETHSEHMVRKVQVMIAEGKLTKDDVAVYYFDNIDGKTKATKLRLDDNGFFIDRWPHGFFDEAADLSYQLLEAVAKRKN